MISVFKNLDLYFLWFITVQILLKPIYKINLAKNQTKPPHTLMNLYSNSS